MEFIADNLRLVHILFGFVGLAAFWVPVLSKKGAARHVLFGKIFVNCAYVVLGAAALALIIRFAMLRAADITVADRPALYGFIFFLAYLTLVTFVSVHQGMAVLRHKGKPGDLDTPFERGLAWAAITASLALITFALLVRPPNMVVLLALSPVGIGGGIGNLRYMRQSAPSPRAWFYEHLGAMLGAGIAFHTAFAVFGINALFDLGLEGWVAVIPWILPAAIGIPAITIWTHHYRRKFGELAA